MSTELTQQGVERLVDPRHIVSIGPGKSGGIQAVIRFENGYGASIIRNGYSYGVELAVARFTGPGNEDWELEYETPVTDDVIGWNDAESLAEHLRAIEALAPHTARIAGGTSHE